MECISPNIDVKYADKVMELLLEKYDSLPKTGKPIGEEWTVAAAVVEDSGSKMRVVSFGTGSKCVGLNTLSPHGDILNDAHAEVIARRGFLIFLMEEVRKWHLTGHSAIFNKMENGRLSLQEQIRFCLASTTVPCGDAAIMPIDEASSSDANPRKRRGESAAGGPVNESKRPRSLSDIHRTGAKCLPHAQVQDAKLIDNDYHVTGQVRTKPGRGDPTASVSCSDKLARWNAVGLQGALLSLLIYPVHIFALIISGETPFSAASLERAINDRIGECNKISFIQSNVSFPARKSASRRRAAAGSIAWNQATDQVQVCVEGRRLGATKTKPNQAVLDISKKCLYKRFMDLIREFKEPPNELCDAIENYGTVSYKSVKCMSKIYQDKWDSVKANYFKMWTIKPLGLQDFTISR